MNKLIIIGTICLVLLAYASAQQQFGQQFPNNQNNPFPNNQNNPFSNNGQPQFPDINQICKDGNCKTDSRFAGESETIDSNGNKVHKTRVCNNGNCYDKTVKSGAISVTSSIILVTSITLGVIYFK